MMGRTERLMEGYWYFKGRGWSEGREKDREWCMWADGEE